MLHSLPYPAVVALALTASGPTSQPPEVPVACNLHALNSAEQARHSVLIEKLRTSIQEHAELPNGATCRIDVTRISMAELGEWVALEHRCCPFLTLELRVTAGNGLTWVSLTGPEGTRDLLKAVLAG